MIHRRARSAGESGEVDLDEAKLEALWDEIWALLREGETQRAVAATLKALNQHGDLPELRYLLGVGLLDLDETEAALPELRHTVELASDWPDAHSALAWAAFRICAFDEARSSAKATLALDPEAAEAHQLVGLLAERDGDEATAIQSFAEARRLDPERFPEPYEMGEDEFLDVAKQAVEEIDEPVRRVLDDTAFFVQAVPAEELLRDSDPPMDPQLLGLFVGRSLLEQSVQDSGSMPNTLYLFQNNLERVASSREDLEEEIRITVLHEIGHHLGWDEDELAERGLA
jgi:predicted Zn-dependent protease with MMP-like domain